MNDVAAKPALAFVSALPAGLRILEARRQQHFGVARPLVPPTKHIALADTRHRLGNADPARTRVIKVGYDEGSLI